VRRSTQKRLPAFHKSPLPEGSYAKQRLTRGRTGKPVAGMTWVKVWRGFLRDEKLHFIHKHYGPDAIVFWIGTLTECDDHGRLTMPGEVFADVCKMEFKRVFEYMQIFSRFGLVTICNADVTECNGDLLKVNNWDKYQHSESYLRVKRHRKKTVTECNGDVTGAKRSVTEEEEEEGEVEEEGDKSNRSFAKFWAAYPKKVGKKPCEQKWRTKKLWRMGLYLLRDVETRKAKDRKWLEGYIPNPLTYLNQERWNDELEVGHGDQKSKPSGNSVRDRIRRAQGNNAIIDVTPDKESH